VRCSFFDQRGRAYAAYRLAALTLTTWPGGNRGAFVRSTLRKAAHEVAAGRLR
jgi:hypothetical protein